MELFVRDLTLISVVADAVYRLVATAAIIVGGGWAYLKYIRGRIMWNIDITTAT